METVKGLQVARVWWQNTEYFQGSESTVFDTLIADLCHCTFVQTLKCTPPKVSPDVNYGLWVIMMYQCRLFNHNKCIPLVGDVSMGKLCMCGDRGIQEISASP